jgi:hypothetical protein
MPGAWTRMKLSTPLKIALALIALLGMAISLEGFVRRKVVLHRLAGLSGLGGPVYESVHRRLGIADVARRYRPRDFNNATPEEAGQAYHALVRWEGKDSVSPLVVRRSTGGAANWGRLPESNPLGVPPKRWYKDLIQAGVAHSLSANQLRFLRATAGSPEYQLFRRFAGAQDSDLLGARYTFAQPQSDAIFFRALPIGRLSAVERAFQTAFARAALDLYSRDAAAAEATLREAANAGLLMMTDGLFIDAISGSTWGKMALLALADVFDMTRRVSEAAAIRRDIEAPSVTPLPSSLTGKEVDIGDIRDALPTIAARRDVAPALKWEYLIDVQVLNVMAFCIRDREFDSRYEDWRGELRRHLVLRQSDERFFDWITEPPSSR